MLFNDIYVWEVVCKLMGKCHRNVANVGIILKVVFREAVSKWACKFINYIGLVKGSVGGVWVIFNLEVWRLM